MVNRLEEDIHQLPMRSWRSARVLMLPLLAISQKPNPREVAQDGILCY
ncbi:hypothetical protein LC653_27530 [Nostoc sp. CHAB 5784]|nr:hypothetical protein [Nostoc mirabile]MCC5667531.1 hypothetical protein [Nostoc mirabile CHAB5784]